MPLARNARRADAHRAAAWSVSPSSARRNAVFSSRGRHLGDVAGRRRHLGGPLVGRPGVAPPSVVVGRQPAVDQGVGEADPVADLLEERNRLVGVTGRLSVAEHAVRHLQVQMGVGQAGPGRRWRGRRRPPARPTGCSPDCAPGSGGSPPGRATAAPVPPPRSDPWRRRAAADPACAHADARASAPRFCSTLARRLQSRARSTGSSTSRVAAP